ncbi:SH3 domain-containing protein [Chloroflexi bacterium TSY]|nr:SH3 domain-containing protein [Chloroflexi bacterium TSY]
MTNEQRIDPNSPFPVALTVTIDTSSLRRGRIHSTWINLMTDNAVTRVAVLVRIPFIYALSRISVGLMALLIIAGFFLGTSASHALFFAVPNLYQNPLLTLPSQIPAEFSQPELSRSPSINQNSTLAFTPQATAPTSTSTLTPSTAIANLPKSLLSAMPAATNSPVPIALPPTPFILSTAQSTNLSPEVDASPQLPKVFMIVPDTYSVNAHATTSADAAILGELPSGTIAPAIGRTKNDDWLRIQLADGREGWVSTEVIIIDREQMARLPLIQ